MDSRNLAHFYYSVAETHTLTAVIAKLSMAAVLLLVLLRNRRPESQLLPLAVGMQGLACLYMATGEPGAGPTALAGLLLGIGGIAGGLKPEGRIVLLPSDGWRLYATGLLYFWAFWYPAWVIRPGDPGAVLMAIKALWRSPMGALPHGTVLLALGMAIAAGPNVHRFFAWSAVCAAAMIAVNDFIRADSLSALGIAAAAAAVAWPLYRGAEAVGLTQEDTPEIDQKREKIKIAEEKKRKEQETPGTPGKVWKIK